MTFQPRVALKLDLRWPLKRLSHIFVGTQQYADEHLSVASVDSIPVHGVIVRVQMYNYWRELLIYGGCASLILLQCLSG